MTQPRYMQIVMALQARRESLGSPLRLPDEHTLAAEFGVARQTMRQALGVLVREGAITRLPRRGTYLQPCRPVVQSVQGKAIGFVPPMWAESISHWLTSQVFDGVSRWASEAGCHLHVLPTGSQPSNHASWAARVSEFGLAGMIWVHPTSRQLDLIDKLSAQVATAVVGRQTPCLKVCHVMPDYDQAAVKMDDRLASLGHLNYGVLPYGIEDAYTKRFVQAFDQAFALRRATFDRHNNLIDLRLFKKDAKAQILLDAFEPEREHMQAYVVLDTEILFHLVRYERFRQMIGQDRSIVAIDFGQHALTACWPGCELCHVRCNWPEVGWRAAALLAQSIAGQQTPMLQTVPVSFEAGQSCLPFDASRVRPKVRDELRQLYGWNLQDTTHQPGGGASAGRIKRIAAKSRLKR